MLQIKIAPHFGNLSKGPFIKDVINRRGGGLPKDDLTLSLFSKSDDEGGGGSKISKK